MGLYAHVYVASMCTYTGTHTYKQERGKNIIFLFFYKKKSKSVQLLLRNSVPDMKS